MTRADPLGVPSPWVRRFAHLIGKDGRVLDLAAGGGRHTRFLLGRGHSVVALDRNLDGMRDLAGTPNLELMETDLEDGSDWPLGAERFAGIVVTRYLHRPLLPLLVDRLAERGALIYETFAEGQGAYGRPASPDYLLAPGELLRATHPTLVVVAYEHGIEHQPGPAAIQRIAAVKGQTLNPL